MLTLIVVFLGINTLSLLSLAFMARRRGQVVKQLEYDMRQQRASEQNVANVLLLAPIQGRTPIKLLNFSEGAIHIRRIEQRHNNNPDKIQLLRTQDPSTDALIEKNLLTAGDYSELDVFADIPIQYPQPVTNPKTTNSKVKQKTREVLAKTTLSIHYFYSVAGDQDQETRFAITLYVERDTVQSPWQERLEVKRYN